MEHMEPETYGSMIRQIFTRTTAQKIWKYIYNPQTHAVLGRDAKSWGLFYFDISWVRFHRKFESLCEGKSDVD